jgi:hypothetical protein
MSTGTPSNSNCLFIYVAFLLPSRDLDSGHRLVLHLELCPSLHALSASLQKFILYLFLNIFSPVMSSLVILSEQVHPLTLLRF